MTPEDLKKEIGKLCSAAKRNHNTAQQVRDVLLYFLQSPESEALPYETTQALGFQLEDAKAAEREALTTLETLREWFRDSEIDK